MTVYADMADALERFFNQQSDEDDSWGPFLYLRPLKTVRMTLRLWMTMFSFISLFIIPLGAILGFLLIYYDYAAARHHDTKIPPVVATENWINRTPPSVVFIPCCLILAVMLLCVFLTHWAWNRRADRLNREPSLPLPAVADAPGVWPPPPTVSGDVS